MTDEKVEIIFTSDSSVQKGGFMIEWKFIEGIINLCFFTLKSFVFSKLTVFFVNFYGLLLFFRYCFMFLLKFMIKHI